MSNTGSSRISRSSVDVELNKRVGRGARAVRKRLGLSLRAAAAAATDAGYPITYSNLASAERGSLTWNMGLWHNMAKVYGVQVESFLLSPQEAHLVEAWRTGGQTGVILALADLAQGHPDDP